LALLQRFREGARATVVEKKKPHPSEETLRLLREGHTLEKIAEIRGRQFGTIVSNVARFVESGELAFDPAWVDKDRLAIIEAACAKLGIEWLKPLKDALPPEITYDEIRLVVARLRREQQKSA
jgi:ATP-dependent DNA helicase RecQ